MRISDWSSDVCSSDLGPLRPKLRPHAWSKTDHSANATRPRSLKPLPSSEFFNGIDPERTLRELSSIAPRSYIGLNEQLGAHQSFGERLVNHKEHFVETGHELPGKVTHVQAMLDEELEGSGGRLNQMEVNKAVVSDVVTYVPHAPKPCASVRSEEHTSEIQS